ncbi:MAG: polyprenyl synthetase family protein [Lacunisphaera sp.]|nr:polyprenyl synthetase family protein [Lacunisphaera sp.]
MDFTAQLKAYRDRVERGLDELVPPAGTRPARLHAAMRYSLQAGGKRLRPLLVLATADLFDKKADAIVAAIALECIHTYSLIHDDLPCMDNDDLRRGRPTAHKQFNEATALLAGDALLTLAFQLIARHYPAATGQALTREFADAAGSEHLIGGQMEDLLAEMKTDATAVELEFIHLNKTAAMLTAALVAGGLCGGANEKQLATLREAGRHLGLAFQIVDDILDATADTKTLGKTGGKDAKSGKTTFVKLHGLDGSRRHARQQSDAAKSVLARLPDGAPFITTLVENMARRSS